MPALTAAPVVPFAFVGGLAAATQQLPATVGTSPGAFAPLAGDQWIVHSLTLTPGLP